MAILLCFSFVVPAHATQEYDDDVYLLAKVIAAEARGEPYDGKLAVGTVVMNRIEHGVFGDTLEKVIYARNQFAKSTKRMEPNNDCLKAAQEIMNGYRSFPVSVLYFQREKVEKWRESNWYCTIGEHNFYSI